MGVAGKAFVFNDQIDLTGFYNLYNAEILLFYDSENNPYHGMSGWPSISELSFTQPGGSGITVYRNGWVDKKYKTIRFVNRPAINDRNMARSDVDE